MGIPVLIIGKSGSGKSTSLRNFVQGEVGIIGVLKKPLPFRTDMKVYHSDNYSDIKKKLLTATVNSIVIDDSSYLIVNQFMRGHASTGKGNNIFELYNSIGDNFWGLIQYIGDALPPNKIVYVIMQEDKNDAGDIKPRTIGKMLDEKVCIEGLFTVSLRAMYYDGKFVFKTKTDGMDVTKSPIDMFEKDMIDNDLKFVDEAIRSYYKIKNQKSEEPKSEDKSITDDENSKPVEKPDPDN